MDFDAKKAAINLTARAYSEKGSYEVLCEVRGCPEKTDAGHQKNWSGGPWKVCPKHLLTGASQVRKSQ